MHEIFDADRVAASLAALLGAAFMGLLALMGTLFSVPPPEKRHVIRAFAEFATGLFGGWLAGDMLAVPLASFINGMVAKLIPGFSAVDSLAAGLLVGSIVIKVWPVAIDLLIVRARKLAEKAA